MRYVIQQCRKYPGLKGNALRTPHDRLAAYPHIRSLVDGLLPPAKSPDLLYLFFLESRPVWICVAVDQANDLGLILVLLVVVVVLLLILVRRLVDADHEPYFLPRLHAVSVRIAHNLHRSSLVLLTAHGKLPGRERFNL